MEAKGSITPVALTKTGSMICCLICCSVSESDADDLNFNNSKLAKATKKIFQYLMIPQKDLIKLRKNKSKLNFCSRCLAFVEDIVELQDKIEILELQIKWNAEVLGRIAVQTPTLPKFDKINKNRKSVSEIWNIFKAPVTKNYIQGVLPNPSVKLMIGGDLKTRENVKLEQVVEKLNISTGSTKKQEKCRTQQSDSNGCLSVDESQGLTKLLAKVDSQKLPYFCIEEEIKSEVDCNEAEIEVPPSPIIVEIKEDLTEYFEDSEDDLFEAILVPKKRSTEANQKEVNVCNTETEGLGDRGSNVINEDNLTEIREEKDDQIGIKVDGTTRYSKDTDGKHPEDDVDDYQKSDNDFCEVEAVVNSSSETDLDKLEDSNARSELDVKEESSDSIVCLTVNDDTEIEHSGTTDKNANFQLELTEEPLGPHSTQQKTSENQKDVEILQVTKSTPGVAITSTTHSEKINQRPSIPLTLSQNQLSKPPTPPGILNTNNNTNSLVPFFFINQFNQVCLWSPAATAASVTPFNHSSSIGGTQEPDKRSDAALPLAVGVQGKEATETANERQAKEVVAAICKRYRPIRAAAPKSFKVVEISDEESLSDGDSESGGTEEDSDSAFEINSGSENDSDCESVQKTKTEANKNMLKDSGKRNIDHSSETNVNGSHTVQVTNVNKSHTVQETIIKGSCTVQNTNTNESVTVENTIVNESHTVQEPNANRSDTVEETNVNGNDTLQEKLVKKYVSMLSFRNVEPATKTLEELTEGKDYVKCTKCEFVRRRIEYPRKFRSSVGYHYSLTHNPVKASQIDKTSDGKPCYKCTKCNFFIVVSSTNSAARCKLSMHYMDLHDAFENMIAGLNKNAETQEKSQSLSPIEGLDYFLCPYPTCGYVVLIQKVTDKRIQCENGARARMSIVAHFRRSYTHVKDRKESLPDTSAQVKDKDGNTTYFKCSKCNEKLQSADELTDHFIREHIFPWDTFPGLYKYNCYEDKSEDDDVLKCLVRGCDYLHKIENPLDDENESREERLLKSYKLFSAKHGSKHNLNSVEYKVNIQQRNLRPKSCHGAAIESIEILDSEEEDEGKEKNRVKLKQPVDICSTKNKNVKDSNSFNRDELNPESRNSSSDGKEVLDNGRESPSETEPEKLKESNKRCELDVREEISGRIVCLEVNDEADVSDIQLNGTTDQNADLQLQLRLTEDPLRLYLRKQKTIEKQKDLEILQCTKSTPAAAISSTIHSVKINERLSTLDTQNQIQISQPPTSTAILNANSSTPSNFFNQLNQVCLEYPTNVTPFDNCNDGGTQNPEKRSDAALPLAVGVQGKEAPETANERQTKEVVAAICKRYRPIRAAAPKSFKQVVEISDEESLSDGDSESGGTDEDCGSAFEIYSGSGNDSDCESVKKTQTVANNNGLKVSGKTDDDHSSERNVNGSDTVQETYANGNDTIQERLVKKYVSMLSFRNVEPATKTLEELTEGKDYVKCTKCDFVCRKFKHRSCNRDSVGHHYSIAHNPVKRSQIDKTSDGKPCYKCTKCNFFITCTSGYSSARCKLSLHYMELHDAFENMIARLNKNTETQEKLQNLSPIEGLDYFLCPYPTCGYGILIEKVTDKRYQCENGARARMNIIEHFRRSFSHVKDRKESLPDTSQFKNKDGKTTYFKCTQCNEKLESTDELTNHFIREHIFPWDTFPGLYKYNCYEDKSEDGDVLKCLVRGCDYLHKIENPLDDESREERLLKAYKLFSVKHASKHNLNSVEYKVNIQQRKLRAKSCHGAAIESIEIPDSEEEDEGKEKERVKRKQPVDICSTKNKKVKISKSHNWMDSNSESKNSSDDEELKSGSESDYNSVRDKVKDAEAVFMTKRRSQDNQASEELPEFFNLPANVREIRNALTEGKDYLKCPRCEFFVLFSHSKSKKFENAKKCAQRRVSVHYAMHNPVKLNDISKTANGEDCYKCTKCSFTVIVDESRLMKKWKKTEFLRRLSLHYLELHEPQPRFANEPTTTNDQLNDLVEAVDYFRCPETSCNYFVLISKFNNTKTPLREGRGHIILHYNKFHNPELNTAILKPVLDEADGTECFKCPKCDFKSIVEKYPDGKSSSLVETIARNKFKNHFTQQHVTPWQNFPGLYPFKCTEEKSGEDDIVRCAYSPSECEFFSKIKYIEGKSRAKCRYAAYCAVRHHYWFHDPKHKHILDKGYSSILPLYKGNKKMFPKRFNFQLKDSTASHPSTSATSVNILKTTSTDSTSSDSQLTVATNSVTAKDTQAETMEAVVSSKQSALKKPIQVDDENNSSSEGGILNLRRSKRISAVKRKRYDLDDCVANEKDCDKDYNVEEDRCRDAIVQDPLNGQGEADKNTCLDPDDDGLLTSQEFVYNTDKEHYRCWKCNYYSEVVYSDKSNGSYGHSKARHRLAIHFNSTHCIEELSFRDPDKLLKVVDEKKFFKCPRCDHHEEIIFNPKKHADGIQGRKNARVNLGHHFFFTHCVPESLIGTNQGCEVSDPNKKGYVGEQLRTKEVTEESDENPHVLEIAEMPISEKLPEPVGTLEKVSDQLREKESADSVAYPENSTSEMLPADSCSNSGPTQSEI